MEIEKRKHKIKWKKDAMTPRGREGGKGQCCTLLREGRVREVLQMHIEPASSARCPVTMPKKQSGCLSQPPISDNFQESPTNVSLRKTI